MSTAGVIRVHDGDRAKAVIMYCHGGADIILPKVVHAGLTRGKDCWDDFTYLARIIFCDLVRDDLDGLTGYGLAASLKAVDGGNRVVDVDCRNERITFSEGFGDFSGWAQSFTVFISEPVE